MSDFKRYLNMYVFESELPSDGSIVKYKPITTGQIKKLLLYETADDTDTIEEALDDLINECVIYPENFDVKSLYLQDRFYLLVEIRRATKGSHYTFQTKCPKCDSQTMHSINLGDLPLKKLDKGIVKKKTQPPNKKGKKPVITFVEEDSNSVDDWNVVQINDKLSVRLDLLTRNAQLKALYMLKDMTNESELTDIQKTIMLSTIMNAVCIKSVIIPEGEQEISTKDAIYLLDNLTQDEMSKIVNWFESKDYGLDFTMKIKCEHCDEESVREIPLDNFFY